MSYRIAISSVFGDPFNPRTWSGAPANVAHQLALLGAKVEGIHPHYGLFTKAFIVGGDLLCKQGWPVNTEQVLRGTLSRFTLANALRKQARKMGVRHILHTGTFDLSEEREPEIAHYLYCDHTWDLSADHHVDTHRYNLWAHFDFDKGERNALAGLTHIFTFGDYVRRNIIERYGVPHYRVTTVGSGYGNIEPYLGPKDYSKPKLLFVAKHLFKAKGGELLLEAFEIARQQRQDLQLTIVSADMDARVIRRGVQVFGHVSWERLQELYRESTLLVQPMLNDPWGQVYLEAMVSKTPVLGLNRNGLPEITNNGEHGFLCDYPQAEVLAHLILDASSQPQRLERMGLSGQSHVLWSYSWRNVARKINEVIDGS